MDFRSKYPPRADGRKDNVGNWLPSTVADLTVEKELKVGEVSVVPCDMCKGRGHTEWEKDKPCWRCNGKGECTFTVEDDRCPTCDESLLGDQIAAKHQASYGGTHFKTKIGMYGMDQTLAYKCPHCKSLWDRYSGKVLDEDGKKDLARKMERAYG